MHDIQCNDGVIVFHCIIMCCVYIGSVVISAITSCTNTIIVIHQSCWKQVGTLVQSTSYYGLIGLFIYLFTNTVQLQIRRIRTDLITK